MAAKSNKDLVTEVSSSLPFIQPYVDYLHSLENYNDYFVTMTDRNSGHATEFIRWGGLLYLLHCMGMPVFDSEEVTAGNDTRNAIVPTYIAKRTPDGKEYNLIADVPSKDRFLCRYKAILRIVPNKAYAEHLGWDVKDLTAISFNTPHVGYGSASSDNLKPQMHKFVYEMAETRAKCRVARDALGITMCSAEELSDAISLDSDPAVVPASLTNDSSKHQVYAPPTQSPVKEVRPPVQKPTTNTPNMVSLKEQVRRAKTDPDLVNICVDYFESKGVAVEDMLNEAELVELVAKLNDEKKNLGK